MGYILLLVVIALDEPLHGCRQRRALARIAEDLQIDRGKIMARIRSSWL